MPHAQVNDIWIHYKDEGEGEPLVLVMGFGAPLQGWDAQIPALIRRHRVIRFDNRGVGRSDKPLGPYSAAQLAQDTKGLLDHLGIESAHVMGLSMGGMAAMELAARHPERVRSLVLAATTPAADARLRWTIGSMTARVTAAMMRQGGTFEERLEAGREELIRRWLPLVFCCGPGGAEEVMLRALMEDAFAEGFSAAGTMGQVAACFAHDARAQLAKIQAPTLVVGGTEDALFPVVTFEGLAKGIPGARLELFEGAPHVLNMSASDAFNEEVSGFLAGLKAQRPIKSSIPSRAPSTSRPGRKVAARS